MKRRNRHVFHPHSLAIATAFSEMALNTGLDITVDLFSPQRTCHYCGNKKDVFIGPKHICASCWADLVMRSHVDGNLRLQLPRVTSVLGSRLI
jgi:hypothetical protein